MDLIEFVLARLDEDEAAARAAVDFDHGVTDWTDDGDPTDVHIARHDPAQVLRSVSATRRLLTLHPHITHRQDLERNPFPLSERDLQLSYLDKWYCTRCDVDDGILTRVGGACETVRAVGEAWATHSEYDEAWRIDAARDDE
ncbi:DUF6221 family protein [Actinomadura flavalba]|uniref:DUF6221 family protein n=1 Tax=Actinomadura flavalba TaxID=1120938 RepID=UPI00035ED2E1|nr:DUF6221 family protein [Actinomadura flavalba]